MKPICVVTGCLLGLILLLVLLGASGGALLAIDRSEAAEGATWPGLRGVQDGNVEQIGTYIRRRLFPRGVYVVGDYAYLADIGVWSSSCGCYVDGGLRVIDVSDPAVLAEVGVLPGSVEDVYIVGDYAYLTAGGTGLRVVNVSDPTALAEVGAYDAPGDARGVHVAGDYAYLADWRSGLHVVDVSDPTSPTAIGVFDMPTSSPRDVYVTGNPSTGSGQRYAYVATEDDGLRIINVSDPAAPTEVGAYEMPGVPFLDVYVAGHYAYVAAGGSGLRVIDVSNPAEPYEVGAYDTPPGYANSVQIINHYAYVTSDYFGHPAGFHTAMAPERVVLQVIDVSDSAAPVEIATYATSGSAFDVHVAGEYTYLAYDWARRVGGLIILRLTGVPEPTPTPSSTPTSTGTPTATVTGTATVLPTATMTPTPTKIPERKLYLPLILRSPSSDLPERVK
ncbi:MAG: LVIVD repeat-containing protein [Anaerolineae bacterium]